MKREGWVIITVKGKDFPFVESFSSTKEEAMGKVEAGLWRPWQSLENDGYRAVEATLEVLAI